MDRIKPAEVIFYQGCDPNIPRDLIGESASEIVGRDPDDTSDTHAINGLLGQFRAER